MKQKYTKTVIVLALPGLVLFTVFLFVPFLTSFRYAFINDMLNKEYVGIQNIQKVIQNGRFRTAFINSLLFSMFGVAILVMISIGLALGFYRLRSKKTLLRLILTAPILLPTAGIVLFFQRVFYTQWYYDLMKNPAWEDFLYVLPIYLMYLWKHSGLCMMIILAAFERIPTELYEAAKLDGATEGICMRKITLKLARPNLLLVVLYGYIQSLRIFRESYFYYRETHYPEKGAYTLQYYMNNHFLRMNYPVLSVAGLLFTATILIVVAVLYAGETRYSREL